MDHANRIAIVTGGASGIGRGAAELLSRSGATVFVLDTRHFDHPVIRSVETDIALYDDVRRATDRIAADHGTIDIVVASAGIQVYGTALTTGDEEWDRVMAVNVRGVWNAARAAIPHMRGRDASIVIVSSVQALATQPNVFAYTVSKHALAVKSTPALSVRTSARSNKVDPQPGPSNHSLLRELVCRSLVRFSY